MDKKALIRKKYFLKRKKHYFQISKNFFNPLRDLIEKISFKKKIKISIYYPSSYEVDVLRIFKIDIIKRLELLLPIIKNGNMNFYKWKKNDVLLINKYGIPEPLKSNMKIPKIILVPLLSFDENKNRLGYGKGFYDKFLNKYLKLNQKIITIGVAFSFQKYHNLPVNNKDVKLDYIITEKGIN